METNVNFTKCREVSSGYNGAQLIFSSMGDYYNSPSGCWAYVGCQGSQGKKAGQTVNLGSPECFNMGTIVHEILHSLGRTSRTAKFCLIFLI